MAGINSNTWLMIPYYTDPKSPLYAGAIKKFKDFAIKSKEQSGFKLAIVDDGAGLDHRDFTQPGMADLLVVVPVNGGKAQAVRQGLKVLLGDPDINPDFIVQYDGDGDQPVNDIPKLANEVEKVAEGNPNTPALVIGDRYPNNFITTPNPSSIAYRQSLLLFFGAIARDLGYPDVRDWVSGARAYTAEYARRFLSRSKSSDYGVEAEQLVVGFLEGAKVQSIHLSDSRPRDPHTDRLKWLQNFDIFEMYAGELVERGRLDLVDTVHALTSGLREQRDSFDLDLVPLGEQTRMFFERVGTAYSADIPYEYRRTRYNGEGPFALRKEG